MATNMRSSALDQTAGSFKPHDEPVAHSEAWRKEVLDINHGIPDVYGVLNRHFRSDVLFNTDEPLEFDGFQDALTGSQMHDLGCKITGALIATNAVAMPNARIIIAKRNHGDYFFYTHSIIQAHGVAVILNAKTGWRFIAAAQKLTDSQVIITDTETLLEDPNCPELHALLESGVRFLVTDRDIEPARVALPFDASNQLESFWKRINQAPVKPVPARDFVDDSPLAIFHTSGTTGVPKMCIYDVRAARESWKPPAAFPLTANSRRMSGLPCAHAIFFMGQTGAFLGGAWTYLPSKFDPKAWLKAMEVHKITYYLGFPYTYMRMAAEDLTAYRLDAMQGWMSGGDTAHAAHIEKFKKFGANEFSFRSIDIEKGSFFINPYGSTEIGGAGIFYFSVPTAKAALCKVGKPALGLGGSWEMKIVDEHWCEKDQGEVGRIVLRGDYSPTGFWNRDDLWHENRVDGWTWIGDLGYIDEEGFLYLLDREVDSIRTSAGTVYSLMAEEHILQIDDVMEATVVQRTTNPETGTGEAVAFVVPKGYLEPDAKPRDWRELTDHVLDHVNSRISNPIAEVRTVALSELPLGCTGKVLKRTLRGVLDTEYSRGGNTDGGQ